MHFGKLFEELNMDKNETLAIPVHPLVILKFAYEKARSFFFWRVYVADPLLGMDVLCGLFICLFLETHWVVHHVLPLQVN